MYTSLYMYTSIYIYMFMYVCIHMLYIISTSRGCPERNCRKIETCETAGQTPRRSGWLRERIHGWRTVGSIVDMGAPKFAGWFL